MTKTGRKLKMKQQHKWDKLNFLSVLQERMRMISAFLFSCINLSVKGNVTFYLFEKPIAIYSFLILKRLMFGLRLNWNRLRLLVLQKRAFRLFFFW